RPAPRASSDLGRFRPPIPDDWREGAEEVKPPLVNAGAGLLGVRQPEVLGRTHERNVLWRLLRRTHDTGRSQIAILRGPEGIGKHALARWLELRAYETGAAWPHRASFDPLESGLDPLARILTRELKTQGLSHEEAEPRVRRLAVLYGQTDPYDIDALLEAANPKDADSPGFRFGAREERLRLLARFLHWAGNERPTLVVLQDVQWSLSAFELLDTFLDLETHAPVPVLFVLTVQEQALATCFREREALDRLARRAGNRCIELPVPPLPGRDHKALIASLVGLDPQVVTRLAQETEGNPLLAIQRVTALHEEGRLEPGPRGLVPRPAGEEARTVASIWRHRLETFLDERSPNSRISVELLAVLGRSVTHEDWLRLCRRAGVNPSQHLVDGLVGAGLLTVEGDTYAFTHHTLRHAVLDLAEREGRLTAHHANAADLLLRHARGVDRHGRIGEHLLLAGRPGLALEHLEKGAESAFVEGQTQRARELIDRWQGALRGLHLPRNDPRQGNGLELEARLALAANEPQPATRAAKRLLRKAIAHGWERHRTTALLLLGWAAYAAGSHDDAVRQLEEALGRVEPTDLPLKSTILFNLARTFAHWGDLDASMRYTAEARTAYLEAHDRRGEALCMLLAANAAFLSGRPDEALTLANTARALSAERGSLGEQAEAVVMAGEIHRSRGDLEKAAEAYKLALRMLRVSGGAVRTAIIELNLGTTSSLRGEHHAAQEMLIGAVQRLHHAGRAGLEAVGHCMLLPSLAATRNQVAYVRHLEAATRLLESARFRESDAIEALERGGRFAMEAGWVELAARTGALAVRMEGW
ncbi:MAG: AAA family ATPase, partial [Myxococcales bacterium]|nr:AAA family ATPase [Myxococcales bacterium]